MDEKYFKLFDKSYPINDKKFQTILSFYLFECPTPNKSYRGKTFSQLGWNGKKQFAFLKKRMFEAATQNLRNNYYPCKKEQLEEHFEQVSSINPTEEYCVFLKYDENTVMQSLYSAIRNAFAHGSFAIQKYRDSNKKQLRLYYFINYDKYLKAELILQEQTLLNWIELVKKGYNPML